MPEFNQESVKDPANKDAISETLLTEDGAVAKDCFLKLCAGLPATALENKDVDLALKTLFEMKPQSPMERMLMTQMIQVSNAAAQCMNGGFSSNCTFQQRKEYLTLATKFHRTFVAQIEALQRLRGQGGQKITVEHVTVNAGGQAIVGNVEHTTGSGDGGGQWKLRTTPYQGCFAVRGQGVEDSVSNRRCQTANAAFTVGSPRLEKSMGDIYTAFIPAMPSPDDDGSGIC